MNQSFWGNAAYRLVIAGILAFLVLTTVAMFIYPGGSGIDKTSAGYQFFFNFFSDLGRTVAHNGQANTVSSLLFTLAMACAGGGLIVFFIAFTRFFMHTRVERGVSWIATGFGVAAGACFVGVGLAPANVNRAAHGFFVLAAFGTFLVATALYAILILRAPAYPNRYAWPFLAFALMLAIYMWVLVRGPRDTHIQVTAQKIIVYASVGSVLLQAFAAQRVMSEKHPERSSAKRSPAL
jgi:hypothetical protein